MNFLESAWRKSANFFDPDELKREYADLYARTESSEFWSDQENAKKVNQRMSRLDSQIKQYENWQTNLSDSEVLLQVGLEIGDESVATEVAASAKKLNDELEKF